MLPINPQTEGRYIELQRQNPAAQDAVARRLVDAMTWCARQHRDGKMPSTVLGDLILSCQADGNRWQVWNRVCGVLIARGFPMFASFTIKGE